MSLFHHRLLMAKALEMANPYLPWDTPKAIKDAMVLYYDIAKQKATNESMALSPILKDLSGNGNDATCYNFGWTEESGISTTEYPNALVSDGVDDYALVQDKYDDEGNLINKKSLVLNRDDGYTVIAKRKLLSKANACFTSKRKNGVGVGDKSGAFQLERYATDKYLCYSFGSSNVINIVNDDIVYMTSQSYNNTSLNIGSAPDSNSLAIFSLLNGGTNVIKGVLYSLLLFNRDLTEEEIEWVKNNLMQ